MPQLISLYIRNVFVGFLLALAFVGMLLWANVGNLWHLISTSDMGFVAVMLLVVFNTVVFAGVQFAIVIMRMAEPEGRDQGGKRDDIPATTPMVPVAVMAPRK